MYKDSSSEHLRTSIRNAWDILNKYYALADLSSAYYAAVVLHPKMKMEYFQSEWEGREDWIILAKKAVVSLWTDEWKGLVTDWISINVPTHDNEPEWKRKKRARLHSDLLDQLE